jgi:hypothetical protein
MDGECTDTDAFATSAPAALLTTTTSSPTPFMVMSRGYISPFTVKVALPRPRSPRAGSLAFTK